MKPRIRPSVLASAAKQSRLWLLFLLLAVTFNAHAQQTYPIHVMPSLTAPYSLKLSDYSQPGSQRLVTTIMVNDVTISNLPVRLHLKMETLTGVTIETVPNISTRPLFLNGGEVSILFGDDMSDYFNINNLQFTGYTKDDYRRTGQLPEGFYRFTVEVRHYSTGRLISNQGKAMAWIALGKPPVLKTPDNKATLGQIAGMPLTFSWVNSTVGVPTGGTQYTFELWEMRIPGIAPEVVVASMPVFYSTTQFTTSLVVHPTELLLEPGMSYAWRVTASDMGGQVQYSNDGKSEVRMFTYQCACEKVSDLKLSLSGSELSIRWLPDGRHTSFRIEGNNPESGWAKEYESNDAGITLRAEEGKTYRFRVQGVCDGGATTSEFSNWETIEIPVKKPFVLGEDCPDCACGESEPGPPITNFTLRKDLQPGDTIQNSSGNSRFILKTVEQQSDGVYKGQFLFWIEIWGIKVLCDYWDLQVNTDNVMVKYNFESVYNPQFLVDVDAVTDYIHQLEEGLKTIIDEIDALLDAARKKYEQGELPESTYLEIQEEVASIKEEAAVIESRKDDLAELDKQIEQMQSEEEKARLEAKRDEEMHSISSLEKKLAEHTESVKEKYKIAGKGILTPPADTFFDGAIQYLSVPSYANKDIEFMNRTMQAVYNSTGKEVSISWNSVFLNGQSVGFYWSNNNDSVYQNYNRSEDGFALFFYFDEKAKSLSYKIKYSDGFFAQAYGVNTRIDREQYAALYKQWLAHLSNDKDPLDFFIRTAWGLNEMISDVNPIWSSDTDSGKGSLLDYLSRVIQWLYTSCSGYDINRQLVPKCIWENSTVTAYPSGIVDGAWEILTGANELVHLINAIDPTSNYFYTAEGHATRQAVLSAMSGIVSMAQSQEQLSAFTKQMAAKGLSYAVETSSLTPQGLYNQGKLHFDILSLFIGIGELKQIKNGANVFKVIGESAANLVESMARLGRAAGQLVQKGYVKTVNLGKTVVIKTMLEVEIARFADDGVLQVSKWIDEPVEIISKIGDDAIIYSWDGVKATEELALVRAVDGTEGIGRAVAKGGSYLDNLVKYKQLFKEGKYTELFAELKKTTAFPKMGKTRVRNVTDLETEYRIKHDIKAEDPIPNYPYSRNHPVTDFELEETGYFVRMYDGDHSKVTGGWIFRIEDLRAYKNVDEIVEQLALEYRPTKIALIEVPEGTILRKSIVGEQEWIQGTILKGSGTQYELKTTISQDQFRPLFDNINDFFK